jgi:ubiquinone/menaquinone biosynthesis C-methylase UbiE
MSAAALNGSEPPAFAPIVSDLRDDIIEHYERRGETLHTPAGLLTLDTNSVLAAGRARLLLRLLAEQGAEPVAGRRVLDLGAGFGALALYCAHLGAEVIAVDPNEERMQVALGIARRRRLSLRIAAAHAQALPFPDESFDLVIANNSLCYIVEESAHRAALEEIRRVLRPGGWVAIRNPNRLHLRDQFTGLPLLSLLPPSIVHRITRSLDAHRSDVRLHSPGASVRQMRRAGFSQACWRAQPGRRLGARFAGYHHVVARRPQKSSPQDVVPTSPGVPRPDPLASPSGPPSPHIQGNGRSGAVQGNGRTSAETEVRGRTGVSLLRAGGLVAVALPENGVAPVGDVFGSFGLVAWLRRRWEAVLFGAMALAFVWMRLVDTQISFWDDEASTVVQYIDRGLSVFIRVGVTRRIIMFCTAC